MSFSILSHFKTCQLACRRCCEKEMKEEEEEEEVQSEWGKV